MKTSGWCKAGAVALLAVAAGCATQAGAGGPMMGSGTGMGMGMGMGMGRGMGPGPGPMADESTTPGWALMSPEEREAHRLQMRSATTRAECERLMAEHRQRMVERAKERNVAPPAGPRRDMCGAMNP